MASGITIAALVLFPHLRSAGRPSDTHVALETAATLIALLAAFLVGGRLLRRPLLNDLMLASALAVLALSNLLFGALPVLQVPEPSGLPVWGSLIGSMLGALLFALAAFVPRWEVPKPALVLAGGAVATSAVLAPAIVIVGGFTWPMPQRLGPALQAVPGLHALAMRPAWQMVMAVLYFLAAVGFFSRSQQLCDEFLGWLAIAALLATASRVAHFLYPATGADWAYTGEGFRLFFYAVLFVGSMREICSYWRALADAAVLEERRRVACDLHDGLGQELAYLTRNLDLLDGETDAETVGRLRQAVDRARAESKRAIGALVDADRPASETTLAEATSEIAERFDIELELDTVADVRLPETRAEAMVRIACEAVTNAARHSGASLVHLSLQQDGQRVRLRVSDTGRGFDPEVDCEGFGLASMRERAHAVGGDLHIYSVPGRGSEVEAVL
jgi:signal transduction histidine kinase